MLRQLGKFEIQRVLGQGGQSTVFLAQDPQLQRLVAIKLLRVDRGQTRRAMLDEARMAGGLRHPAIAAVYDAGEDGESAYIVFEYVEGRSLDRLLRDEGPMEAVAAAGLMAQVLDALTHAHAAGIVHRDLKPSNVMVEACGRPRVLDFGVALRAGGHDRTLPGALLGTPVYMAPEYIASGTVAPSNDVFAAGLMLFELVFGRRAIDAGTDFEALHRIVNEPLTFPADAFERADERLIDVIAKATVRDPVMRYPSAAVMRQALLACIEPVQRTAPRGSNSSGTLEFLLRRMQHRSDFPSMSAAMTAVNRLAHSEQGDANRLSALILKDFALTNKLLRVANSAQYNNGRSGVVSTVSRAIVVLGFDAVRGLAMSLLLFERLQDKKHAEALKTEFLRVMLNGMVARELSVYMPGVAVEEYFVCALFRNLGRLLAQYYLRDEAVAVEKLMANEMVAEDLASRRILGIDYRGLGIGVACSWGFPQTILRSMEPTPPPRSPPATTEERLRWVSAVSELIASAIEHAEPAQRAASLVRVTKPYAAGVVLDERALLGLAERAILATAEVADALQLDLRASVLGRRLAGNKPPARLGTDAAAAEVGGTQAVPAASVEDARMVLASGIQDITDGLLEELGQADLLRIVVETAYRALGLRRVLMCLRDERDGSLAGCYGFGQGGARPWSRFRVQCNGDDLFAMMISRNVDLLVHDADEPKVRERLPAWYLEGFAARSFLIMPMRRGDSPVGLLYADQEGPGGIRIGEAEFALLKTLRNQAVLVLKLGR